MWQITELRGNPITVLGSTAKPCLLRSEATAVYGL